MNASATGTIAAISAMMGKKMDAMQKKMTSSLGDKISQCIKRELDRRKLKRSRTRSSDVEEEDDKDDEDDEDDQDHEDHEDHEDHARGQGGGGGGRRVGGGRRR